MEHLAKHWSFSKRAFPSPTPVRTMGWLPGKTHWIRRKDKRTLNFSFLLAGEAELRFEQETLHLKAPCLMTFLPGVNCEFGPSGRDGRLDEFYISYYPDALERFEAMNLVDRKNLYHKLESADLLRSRLQRLNDELGRKHPRHRPDWLDRATEVFLMETLRGESPAVHSTEDEVLYAVVEWLKQRLDTRIDWDKVASKHGMSPRSFRRHWKRVFHVSPNIMLTELRLERARRLLEETSYQMQDIAARIGIEDRLYFSRFFKSHIGMSPSTYRDQMQLKRNPVLTPLNQPDEPTPSTLRGGKKKSRSAGSGME